MLPERLDRGCENTSGVRRAWVASRVRRLIGLTRRSRFQRTTTTGLILCVVGEHCLVSLRAGNKRQRVEDIPLRWNPCRHHLREGNSLNLTRCEMCCHGIGQRGCTDSERGYLWMLVGVDLNPVASLTVLLTEIWYVVDK